MPAIDQTPYAFSDDVTQTATNALAVTPSDSADLTYVSRGLYVGGQGDVSVVTRGGQTVTFVGAVGLLPVRVSRVRATGTTATDIVTLW